MAFKAAPRSDVEIAFDAIRSIGLGYDICNDLRLKFCKKDSCLIELGRGDGHETILPGGIAVQDVPRSIKVDKGERMRYTSDVLSFQQMAEQFNQELSLLGKIPSGCFNHMFDFTGTWQKDASETKSLAFDGWFITLYSVALSKSQVILRDHIRDAVPSSWDPAALARFIEKFGTHIIVGVKMGGKDVICMRQKHSSTLQPAEFQRKLKEMADRRFSGTVRLNEEPQMRTFEHGEQRLRFADSIMSSSYSNKEENMIRIFKRRGGIIDESLSHSEWLETVQSHPDVISMSFIPITSLLNGVPGSGFLSHAINLYLRYKPRIEELHQFLEFQLPRQWAPVFSDLPLGPQRKSQSSAYLHFSLMGPKLHVNTSLVDVGKRPVTGLRLYLEGKRGNRLAIHLQHLSSLPHILKLEGGSTTCSETQISDRKYCEPIQWKYFSHIYTAPVESEDDNDIVTGAQLVVEHVGLKKVLFLRLLFSKVSEAVFVKHDWIGSPALTQKSGLISTLISTHFSTPFQRPAPQPENVITNSAVYPGGPPVTVQAPRLLKLIDTTELSRGPQDSPGYWVVSGAKLHLERGKISLRLKFSLLSMVFPDDDESI